MPKLIAFFALAALVLAGTSALAGPYDGCKDSQVKRSNNQLVDVSKELSDSQRRVEQICNKELPKRLDRVKKLAGECGSGNPGSAARANTLDRIHVETQELVSKVKKACETMQENLKTAQKHCASRASYLQTLSSRLQKEKTAEKVAQKESLSRQSGVYADAWKTFQELGRDAGESSKKIYASLPDKDEARNRAKETADTKDPELDALVSRLRGSFRSFQQQVPQPQPKAACGRLASERGDLTQIASVLKNNLWPNGKKSARALNALATGDQAKAREFGLKSNQTAARANLLQDTTSIPGTPNNTPWINNQPPSPDGFTPRQSNVPTPPAPPAPAPTPTPAPAPASVDNFVPAPYVPYKPLPHGDPTPGHRAGEQSDGGSAGEAAGDERAGDASALSRP